MLLRNVTINWGNTRKTLCIPNITPALSAVSVFPLMAGEADLGLRPIEDDERRSTKSSSWSAEWWRMIELSNPSFWDNVGDGPYSPFAGSGLACRRLSLSLSKDDRLRSEGELREWVRECDGVVLADVVASGKVAGYGGGEFACGRCSRSSKEALVLVIWGPPVVLSMVLSIKINSPRTLNGAPGESQSEFPLSPLTLVGSPAETGHAYDAVCSCDRADKPAKRVSLTIVFSPIIHQLAAMMSAKHDWLIVQRRINVNPLIGSWMGRSPSFTLETISCSAPRNRRQRPPLMTSS